MTDSWRLLPYTAHSAGEELANGVALLNGLAATGKPALRWYGATEPALVLGSGQKLSDIDREACTTAGIRLHRRASGGTAVLFTPGFLMQDIALPVGHRLQRGDVTESYHWLGAVWVDALATLGIAAAAVDVARARTDTQALDPLVRRACFGGISPYEVLVGGRKLVGFSQIRRRAGSLLQVGIYRRWPGHELAALLDLPAVERDLLVERLAARVAGLAEILPAPPPDDAIMHAFAAALARIHGITSEPADWTAAEREAQIAALPRFAPLATIA
ncbi:MAG: ligase [Oscillochloris sp.]|nr:ligase [Oscillochloris sp.]